MNNQQASGLTRRRLLASGAGAAVALPFTAAKSAAKTGKVRIIHASPATLVLWSVTYLAEDMGFYADEGLQIERILLNGGPTAMTALVAGEGDVQVATPGEALSAVARGQDIRILESYTFTDAYSFCFSKAYAAKKGVASESPLRDRQAAVKAAKGAKIGITAPGSATDLIARMSLRQAGLDPNTDVQLVPLGSIVNVVSAMAKDAIDGGALLSPFTEQTALEFGSVNVLDVAAGEIPAASRLQGQALHARGADIAARSEDFAAMVRADLRALRMIQTDPNAARDKLRQTRFKSINEAIWPAVWKGQLPTFKTPRVQADSLKAWIETGSIGGNPNPDAFPYSRMLNMEFVEQGLKKLNWSL